MDNGRCRGGGERSTKEYFSWFDPLEGEPGLLETSLPHLHLHPAQGLVLAQAVRVKQLNAAADRVNRAESGCQKYER